MKIGLQTFGHVQSCGASAYFQLELERKGGVRKFAFLLTCMNMMCRVKSQSLDSFFGSNGSFFLKKKKTSKLYVS